MQSGIIDIKEELAFHVISKRTETIFILILLDLNPY